MGEKCTIKTVIGSVTTGLSSGTATTATGHTTNMGSDIGIVTIGPGDGSVATGPGDVINNWQDKSHP